MENPVVKGNPVITGTPADARTAGPRTGADSGQSGQHENAGGSYDETSGIVYEVTPGGGGFAALGLKPDPGSADSGGTAAGGTAAGGTAAGGTPADSASAGSSGTPAASANTSADPDAAAARATAEPAAGTNGKPTIVLSGLDQTRTLPQGNRSAQPLWNHTTASVQAGEDEKRSSLLGTFGGLFSRSRDAGEEGDDQPPLTRMRDLPLDQKLRIWRIRALIVVAVGVVFSIISDWEVGLTLAIVAGIVDTIYRTRTVESHYWKQPGTVDRATWRAQRRTQKQLARMERLGYVALNRRPIPDSVEVIDHLVVGPTGVYAIDSEKWDKDLPVRARNGKTLFHGPQSMKDRLEHARWEAGQASELLSEALGTEIVVRPALAIYGPKIPWDIAIIREVDVFSGDRLKKYLHSRARKKGPPQMSAAEIAKIHSAAATVLPLGAGKAAAPVG
jgi:hypothetical protein